MSHLYSMFAKQVSSYCKGSQDMPTNMCKRNLLMYGINKLQDMNESHLDSMDPYQRGAHDISKYSLRSEEAQTYKKKNRDAMNYWTNWQLNYGREESRSRVVPSFRMRAFQDARWVWVIWVIWTHCTVHHTQVTCWVELRSSTIESMSSTSSRLTRKSGSVGDSTATESKMSLSVDRDTLLQAKHWPLGSTRSTSAVE